MEIFLTNFATFRQPYSCARAGERALNRRFVLFAAKTSFTVADVVTDTFLGLLCRIFTLILGRFA